ncbi:MAG: right-handed parallel beta-helix repeat-containing protein [Vicinamibacteria bacterium]
MHRTRLIHAAWSALALCACGEASTSSSAAAAAGPAAPAPAAASGGDWAPPLGVPVPPFGIRETAGAATYYVDNTHALATDDANPQGSAARPRRTVPQALPEGAVVELRGGPYQASRLTWSAAGTAAAPVFVRGVGSPVLATGELRMQGSYLAVEGVVVDGGRVTVGPGDHLSLRRSEVRGYAPRGHSAAVAIDATDVVIHANEIHRNGDASADVEEDVHGVKASTGAARVWIVDNDIHHNGGDAVQIGSARADEPWAQHVYIGRNQLHDDRENGVDIKQARDVIVSENRIHSYRPSSSSSGEAVVVHDDPERVWVVNNEIRDAARGVACTGAVGFYVIGNLVHRIHHAGGDYDPDSLYGTQAVLVYSTPEVHVVSNTIFDVDGGISFPSGARAVIVDNIVAGLSQPSHHVGVGGPGARASLMSHNLLGGSVRVKWGSNRAQGLGEFQAASGQGAACVAGDPRFENPAAGDFRLRAGSPAIDAGVVPDAYATFQRLYGLSLGRDRAGSARPSGRAYDLGALERP